MGKLPAAYDFATKVAAVVMVDASGGDIAGVAREMGIPYTTLRQWCIGERSKYVLAMSRLAKGDMVEAFRVMVWQSLGLALGKAHEASYTQLMTGAGIAADKMRVLSGADAPPPAPSVQVNVSQTAINLSALSPDEQFQLYQLLSRAAPAPAAEPVGPGAGEPAGVPAGELPDPRTGPAEPVQ